MTYRIHYTLPDGTEDSVVFSADSVEEIRGEVHEFLASRNATNPWSEEVT